MFDSLTAIDQERLSRGAALGACALSAVFALWLLVRLVWLLLPHADPVVAPPPVAAGASGAPAQQSLAKWHLFGNPMALAAVQARNAPSTTLRLTLRGTLALPDPKQGMAVIGNDQGQEQSFAVDDDVAPNVRLAEVYTDHVVLEHEGALEQLQLPRPEAHAPDLPAANKQNLAGTPGAPGMPGGKASSVPPTYVPPQMAHGAIDWNKAQRQLQIDPAELQKQVHMEPVFENGKVSGMRFSAGGQIGNLMAEAGLRANDVVTSVNGNSLVGLTDPAKLASSLGNASSLQVTVMRDGKPATLTLNLR